MYAEEFTLHTYKLNCYPYTIVPISYQSTPAEQMLLNAMVTSCSGQSEIKIQLFEVGCENWDPWWGLRGFPCCTALNMSLKTLLGTIYKTYCTTNKISILAAQHDNKNINHLVALSQRANFAVCQACLFAEQNACYYHVIACQTRMGEPWPSQCLNHDEDNTTPFSYCIISHLLNYFISKIRVVMWHAATATHFTSVICFFKVMLKRGRTRLDCIHRKWLNCESGRRVRACHTSP